MTSTRLAFLFSVLAVLFPVTKHLYDADPLHFPPLSPHGDYQPVPPYPQGEQSLFPYDVGHFETTGPDGRRQQNCRTDRRLE